MSRDPLTPPDPGGPATPTPLVLAAARPGRIRDLALRASAAFRADPGGAERDVGRMLREARHLHSRERRFVADALYGLFRSDLTLGFLLARGGDDGRGGPEGLARWLGWLVLAEGLPPEDAAATWEREGHGGRPDFARFLRKDEEIAAWAEAAGASAAERLGVEASLPTWLAERLLEDHGEEGGRSLAAAMNHRAPLAVRANTARIDRDGLVARLAGEGVVALPCPLSRHGAILTSRVNAQGLQAYRDGLFWVQDEGSQLVAEAVAPPPGGLAVDACAGAGGKTLSLCASMGGGQVVALDTRGSALEELGRRARRAGAARLRAVRIAPHGPLPPEVARLAGRADRVLVDAPCSGSGVLRRNPGRRYALTSAELDAHPPRQLAILRRMAPLVAPGGRLVYATCSVLRAENQEVVDAFLAAEPGFALLPLAEILGPGPAGRVGDGRFLQVTPDVHGTDGFFAAVLARGKGRGAGET
ncbi:RsmB/NOP family class I SAM-dependent RNA methyltransferase [Myxococcota bacterium]|nr:RsmB/NOP family class I SAM-dependent RNA methyltransferase [Myxococcota bacterium]